MLPSVADPDRRFRSDDVRLRASAELSNLVRLSSRLSDRDRLLTEYMRRYSRARAHCRPRHSTRLTPKSTRGASHSSIRVISRTSWRESRRSVSRQSSFRGGHGPGLTLVASATDKLVDVLGNDMSRAIRLAASVQRAFPCPDPLVMTLAAKVFGEPNCSRLASLSRSRSLPDVFVPSSTRGAGRFPDGGARRYPSEELY